MEKNRVHVHYNQSHYREIKRWEIFMEQELRLRLDLGRLVLLKKIFGPIVSNFICRFFESFIEEKMKNIVKVS